MNTNDQEPEKVLDDEKGDDQPGLRALQAIAAGIHDLASGPINVRANVNDEDVEKIVQAIVRPRRSGQPQSSELLTTLGSAPR